jgi:3-deoxy-D-manno-octulosonate 8-phosphate phosphatase (KDO 8-P phosphatase)
MALDDTQFRQRAAAIRLLLCDIDGVLTDGGLYYWGDQGFAVRFHVRDGLGLKLAAKAGLVTGIISARPHPEARRRAEELEMQEVHLAVEDKALVLKSILARRQLRSDQVCFIGDDIVDLAAFEQVGLRVAVSDAIEIVRQAADWITTLPGGNGAVRELVDRILSARETPLR